MFSYLLTIWGFSVKVSFTEKTRGMWLPFCEKNIFEETHFYIMASNIRMKTKFHSNYKTTSQNNWTDVEQRLTGDLGISYRWVKILSALKGWRK